MGGLRCGEVSQTAFDTLSTLVDGYVAIEDDWAYEAIRALARPERRRRRDRGRRVGRGRPWPA